MKSTPDTAEIDTSGASSLKSSTLSNPSSQTAAVSTAQPKNNNAAVPITIYRELVAELQHTQQRLREVSDRNEQLAEHNQKLRHEIEHVVQTALNIRTIANALQPDAPILPQLSLQPVQSTDPSHGLDECATHQISPQQKVDDADSMTMKSSFIGKSPQIQAQPEWASPQTPQPSSSAQEGQNETVHVTLDQAQRDVEKGTQLDHVLAAAIARQLPKSQSTDQSPKVTTSAGRKTTPKTVSIETPDGTVTLNLPSPHQLSTTEQPHQTLPHSLGKGAKRPPLGGWWLTIIVVFIVVSAFSAGFMAMLFLQGQRSIDQRN